MVELITENWSIIAFLLVWLGAGIAAWYNNKISVKLMGKEVDQNRTSIIENKKKIDKVEVKVNKNDVVLSGLVAKLDSVEDTTKRIESKIDNLNK